MKYLFVIVASFVSVNAQADCKGNPGCLSSKAPAASACSVAMMTGKYTKCNIKERSGSSNCSSGEDRVFAAGYPTVASGILHTVACAVKKPVENTGGNVTACNISYGAEGKYTSKSISKFGIVCGNATFPDPAVGLRKACYNGSVKIADEGQSIPMQTSCNTGNPPASTKAIEAACNAIKEDIKKEAGLVQSRAAAGQMNEMQWALDVISQKKKAFQMTGCK